MNICQQVQLTTPPLTGVGATRDWSGFHRVFSRARWDLDEVGRRLLLALVARLGGVLRLVLDDTLAPHKGPHVFGLGCHLDAVRSTKRTKVFAFGHVWVVRSVVVELPFASGPWALPILFRLYRTVAACAARGDPCECRVSLRAIGTPVLRRGQL